MENSSLISVIIPVYKAERYLRRCIDSVLSQTYRDLEVILIDDGSPDRCGEICDEYAKHDNRVKVIHQYNAGPSVARNRGILETKRGGYIAFVDSDDYLERHMYERLISKMNESHADIVICNYITESNSEQIVMDHGFGEQVIEKPHITNTMIRTVYEGKPSLFFASLWTKLYQSTLIREHQLLFDESRIRAEDRFFNLHAFRHSKKIAFVEERLYHYVSNENSIMHTIRRSQLQDWDRNTREMLELNKKFFGFDIDYSAFYLPIIILGISYMMDVFIFKHPDRYEIVREFYNSKFFQEVTHYDRKVPLYAKLLCRFIRNRYFTLSKLTIITYAAMKRLKHFKYINSWRFRT